MRSLIILMLVSRGVSAQEPIHTLFLNNYSRINPAFVAFNDFQVVSSSYRNQWVNAEGSPKTFIANAESRFFISHGIGVSYMNEQIGNEQLNQGNLSYNYQWTSSGRNPTKLSFGAAYRFSHVILFNNWNPPVTPDDPSLSSGKGIASDLNLGVTFKKGRSAFGISAVNLFETRINNIDFNLTRTFYFYGHYILILSRKNQLHFKTIVRTDAVKLSIDLNATLHIDDRFTAGLTLRNPSWICAMAGWKFKIKNKGIYLGYAYDHYFSEPKIYGSTHEFVLRFNINDSFN